ncbi:glycosyltransferase [Microbacterium maritypicum]|uniref:glycosyltransferase n=1 Tax=Microbacterium maritypicum TaxID=33918 RepID=UPI0037FF9BF2
MPHRIVAVIPVFRAPENLPRTIESILRQVDSVVVVDDGSRSVETVTFPDRTEVISAEENRGIATALNTAIGRARELGATHILTLDQDSALADGHVERLLTRIEAAESQGVNVAAAVPGVVGGAPVLGDPSGGPFDPIQSGQLLPVGAFEAIGEFRADLFIDAVDSEFTVRAREAGFQFLVDEELTMEHALGEAVPLAVFGRPLVILGKQRHVLYHAPWRTYYMVRNSVWLSRQYGAGHRGWMRRRNRKMAEMVLWGSVLAPDRIAQLRAVRAGWRDGRRGTLGRIRPDVLRRLGRQA